MVIILENDKTPMSYSLINNSNMLINNIDCLIRQGDIHNQIKIYMKFLARDLNKIKNRFFFYFKLPPEANFRILAKKK